MDLRQVRVFGLRFACPAEKTHAFYEVARHVLSGRHDLAEARLGEYYTRWSPRTAAEVLGLPDSHELADYPPMAAVLPWYSAAPGAHLAAVEEALRDYYARRGMDGWGVTDGWFKFGPASPRAVRVLVARVAGAVADTRAIEEGAAEASIVGTILEDDRGSTGANWALDVGDGLLVAILAALGWSRALARIEAAPGPTPRAVRRSEVGAWSHVRSGLFTEGEALRVFDELVRGRPA